MAQHLRQLGQAEFTGSAGPVGKLGQAKPGALVSRLVSHAFESEKGNNFQNQGFQVPSGHGSRETNLGP